MDRNYTIIHLHSMFSNGVTNIDSITDYKEYICRAKELGMKAMCFTEHGSVFSWLHKKEEIEKAGMKYIHGVEAYVTENLAEKVRDNYHCVLIARNYDGFLELNRLVSNSFNREDGHFYYAPRITMDELTGTSDNIIVSTACLGGILSKGNDNIRERFIHFLRHNAARCFLEIQHHNIKDQIDYNKYLYTLSNAVGVRLIAGTDTHALNDEHMEGRAVLQKAKGVRFEDESSWDLTFKSYDELVKAYQKQDSLAMDVVLEAIENTNVLADMIEEFEIDRSYKYPHLWDEPEKLFRQKIEEGIRWRGVDKYPNYQEYLDRIEYEMEAYIHNQAIDFMLLMDDVISWCKTQDIQVGYGRGSVNGSVIAWLLGITEMDSIKHKLNFDRFMNVERVSLSDIDTDFPPSRIEEVKDYLFNRHGLYCSDIITFNTIADKGAIRDVGRALGISLDDVSKICDAMDNEEQAEKVRKKYPDLFRYVDLVKGTIVSVGSHPCGTIVSGFEVLDKIGTFTTSTSKYRISEINMKEVDSLNYVKLDLLKLDTIEIINNTCKLAGIERLTPDNVDVNDTKVWNAMRDDTTEVFQWNSNVGSDYIKKLLSDKTIEKFKRLSKDVDRMTLLSIGNSAIRPAGASYREDLANGVIHKTGSKPIDDFLSNTFGFLTFQEQIILFLHQYCGFTMGEADNVRRGIAKKTGTDKYIPIIKDGGYMSDEKKHYIQGYIATMKERYGIDEKKSEEDIVAFIKVIEDASAYLFSLNHSQPYSYEGYVCAYLRTYYPLEFMTSALNAAVGKEERTREDTMYAKSVGITFKPPKFRHSKAGYFCDKSENAIYKGIGSLKFMNDNVADELYEMGKLDFEDFVDALYYMKEHTCINTKQVDILIKIDFFSEFGDINVLLRTRDMFETFYGKTNISKNSVLPEDVELFGRFASSETATRVEDMDYSGYLKGAAIPQECYVRGSTDRVSFKKFVKYFNVPLEDQFRYATKVVYGKFFDVDVPGIIRAYIARGVPKCQLSQKLKYQIENLGYVDYINPELNTNRYVCVTGLDEQYSPKFTAYNLRTGDTCELKVHKHRNPKDKSYNTSFDKTPFEDGDVLYMEKCSKKPKLRKNKETDKWEEVPGEFVWWLDDYKVVKEL